jgi:hypothetical protein
VTIGGAVGSIVVVADAKGVDTFVVGFERAGVAADAPLVLVGWGTAPHPDMIMLRIAIKMKSLRFFFISFVHFYFLQE